MSSVLSSDSVHCAFNGNVFCSSLQRSRATRATAGSEVLKCHYDGPVPTTL